MWRFAERAVVMGVGSLMLTACAPVSGMNRDGVTPPRVGTPGPEGASRVVAGWEVARFEGTLYDAIRRVRPYLLQSRSPSFRDPQGTLPAIIMDNVVLGDMSVLHSLSPTGVKEIRWIGRSELTILYGRGDLGSALVIRTR